MQYKGMKPIKGIGEGKLDLEEWSILCFKCKHFRPKSGIPEQRGHVVGICEVTENIGEFNNAVYYGTRFVPCSTYKFEEVSK